jgi:hypothetical protein
VACGPLGGVNPPIEVGRCAGCLRRGGWLWVVMRVGGVGNVSAVGYVAGSERLLPGATVVELAVIGGYGTGGLRVRELRIGRRRW